MRYWFEKWEEGRIVMALRTEHDGGETPTGYWFMNLDGKWEWDAHLMKYWLNGEPIELEEVTEDDVTKWYASRGIELAKGGA